MEIHVWIYVRLACLVIYMHYTKVFHFEYHETTTEPTVCEFVVYRYQRDDIPISKSIKIDIHSLRLYSPQLCKYCVAYIAFDYLAFVFVVWYLKLLHMQGCLVEYIRIGFGANRCQTDTPYPEKGGKVEIGVLFLLTIVVSHTGG